MAKGRISTKQWRVYLENIEVRDIEISETREEEPLIIYKDSSEYYKYKQMFENSEDYNKVGFELFIQRKLGISGKVKIKNNTDKKVKKTRFELMDLE